MDKISIYEWLHNYCKAPDVNGCIEPISHYFPGWTAHQNGIPKYPIFYGKVAYKQLYELVHGPIKKGNVVRHLCGNKRCVNIRHLKEGTHSDNRLDQAHHKAGYMPVYRDGVLTLKKLKPK